ERFTIERYLLAHHAGIAAESPLPEAGAEQDYALASWLIFFRPHFPAEDRPHAHRGEKTGRHFTNAQTLRIAFAAQHHIFGAIGQHAFKGRLRLSPVVEVRHGNTHLRDLLGIFGKEHQSAGVRISERTKQHSVHHAEDRSVRTDAERKRKHGHHRERRRFAQHAHRVANVL